MFDPPACTLAVHPPVCCIATVPGRPVLAHRVVDIARA